MLATTVSDIMTITLHTPDIDTYNPSEAISLWNISGLRSRRPDSHSISHKSVSSTCSTEQSEVGLVQDDLDKSVHNESNVISSDDEPLSDLDTPHVKGKAQINEILIKLNKFNETE